ncbi:MAG: CDP-alcohol phosphatidyltransferase family protein [bacterium]|nr:CDP-alcohol phosphatidyltransferase family protein [bacterium]
MNNQSDKPPHRLNLILLGPFERRVLPWMANRLPRWVTPDHMTYLGLYSALLVGIAYYLTTFSYGWLWLASAGLVLNWVGDSLDGTLARVRHIERERYGFFVDHYSDTIASAFICLGMGLSPIMDLRIALGIMVAYFAMMTLVYLVTLSRDVFKISFAGVGPTEIRLFIIICNTLVWYKGNPRFMLGGLSLTLYDWIGLGVTAVLLGTYIVAAEVERRKLDKLDPPPAKITDENAKVSAAGDGRIAPVFFPPAREKEPTKVSK